MTREEKIQKRKDRALKRRSKRKFELNEVYRIMSIYELCFKSARDKLRGKDIFVCEMGWRSCQKRGYCDGDC